MMQYHEIKVGEKTLKLRIRMRDHAELDKACGGFLACLTDEKIMGERTWGLLGNMLHVALRPYEAEHGKHTREMVDNLMDEMVDDGWTVEEAAECIMRTAAVSGFFPKAAAEAIMRGKQGETPEPPAA